MKIERVGGPVRAERQAQENPKDDRKKVGNTPHDRHRRRRDHLPLDLNERAADLPDRSKKQPERAPENQDRDERAQAEGNKTRLQDVPIYGLEIEAFKPQTLNIEINGLDERYQKHESRRETRKRPSGIPLRRILWTPARIFPHAQ